jgi:hypothetical protein
MRFSRVAASLIRSLHDIALQFLLAFGALTIASVSEQLHPASIWAAATVSVVEIGGLVTAALVMGALVVRALRALLDQVEGLRGRRRTSPRTRPV